MSTSIDQAFVTSYEARVKHIFQRTGAYLRDSVRLRSNVVGSTAVFNKVGKGIATTKARHGTITPMNMLHEAPSCTLADFYGGDWVDKLDEAKIYINERDVIAKGGAMALGRKVDDQIITILATTTVPAVPLDSTSKAATLASLITFSEAAWANDVPNEGEVYGLMTPRLWSQANLLDQFSRADWVRTDGQAFVAGPEIGVGRWKDWNGVKWKMHTGLPNAGAADAKVFIYHKYAPAYAIAAAAGNVAGRESVAADITWHGDRAAHFVNHLMSGQACMVDTTGVIEGTQNDTTPVASS